MIKLQRRNMLRTLALLSCTPIIPLLPVRPKELITRKFFTLMYPESNNATPIEFEDIREGDIILALEGKKQVMKGLAMEDWSPDQPEAILFKPYDN